MSSHGLKRSWRSCPRQVNAGNKNTPSTHHPRRRNVTTLTVGLKKTVTYAKISPKSGEPQRYIWGTQKKKKKKNHLLSRKVILSPGLPPSTAGLTVELSLLYNLLYASYIKARCSQQSGASILSSQAQSVLLSLDRGELFTLLSAVWLWVACRFM